MDGDRLLHDLAVASAQLALRVSGDTCNVKELMVIDESEIKDVYKSPIEGNSECYLATLSNEDTLCCDYFHKGSAQGQTHCLRHVGMSVELPISPRYFNVLKQKYLEEKRKK